jgi:hypothetical protein
MQCRWNIFLLGARERGENMDSCGRKGEMQAGIQRRNGVEERAVCDAGAQDIELDEGEEVVGC